MNVKCPNLHCSFGKVPDKTTLNGFMRCPLCCGNGFIARSLPSGREVKLVASDLNLTRPKYWQPMDAGGIIRGLPHVQGKAIATDGCLVVIEQANGEHFIGHIDNFEANKKQNERSEKRSDAVNTQERERFV